MHVRVNLNGEFYGLFSLVENVDKSFLKRRGMNQQGELFKAVHWLYSNLRPPATDSTWQYPCKLAPGWRASGQGQCPSVYRAYVDKKQPPKDPLANLREFVRGLGAWRTAGTYTRPDHFSAQPEHFPWDTLGGFSDQNSSV